jgi:hypothetical protein
VIRSRDRLSLGARSVMRFGILGPFVVADDQGRELALGGPKQRAVLAILLLHAGEVVPSDRLIEGLWGGRAPATAAKTIQVYVSNLRKALGDPVPLTQGGGYALDTRPRLDLGESRPSLHSSRRSNFRAGRMARECQSARPAKVKWGLAPIWSRALVALACAPRLVGRVPTV